MIAKLLSAALLCLPVVAFAQTPPAAIFTDPPHDVAAPARM